jgi:hypothetical protein
MNLRLAIADFRWSGDAKGIADTLGKISFTAGEAGVLRLAVMAHAVLHVSGRD